MGPLNPLEQVPLNQVPLKPLEPLGAARVDSSGAGSPGGDISSPSSVTETGSPRATISSSHGTFEADSSFAETSGTKPKKPLFRIFI